MARIAGVDLPREKRVEIALTYIFGIGLPTSQRILDKTAVSPNSRVRDLTDSEVARLRQVIEREVRARLALAGVKAKVKVKAAAKEDEEVKP